MKKIRIALICAAFSSVALSGCTSDQLKSTQKTERQALSNKRSTDRQVERAQTALTASTATIAAATANLAAKKLKQQQAEADLRQIFCPQPELA